MEFLEPVEKGSEQAIRRVRHQAGLAHQTLAQRLALDQRHHHIGSAVGLEEVEDAHDRRRPVEPRQGARLVEKTFAAPRKLLGMLGRVRQHRGAALAQRQRRRQILLDGDVAIESGIQRPIGDAEGALAEDRFDLIAAQQGPGGNTPGNGGGVFPTGA